MLSLLMLAAATAPSCDGQKGGAYYQCGLDQSEAQFPEVDCDEALTQLDINICSGREYLRAEIALNERWEEIRQRYDDSALFDAILAAQKDWLAYRDSQCATWTVLYEGGSIAPMMVASCKTKLTKARVTELDQYLTDR